jgi:hypothetical protein
MIQVLLAALLLPFQADARVPARFKTLHAKNDRAGCVVLWRENPALALPTIEEDLDAALALRDKTRAPSDKALAPSDRTSEADLSAVRALEERALWGAQAARDALGAPLIADLAAARIGWNERDRGLYRDQRAIQLRAKSLLEKGDNRIGLEAAQEAAVRALALGDWHGAATAYETCAAGHQALSALEDALVSWSQARLFYRELDLADREVACLRGALDMCFAVNRPSRGREIADEAAAAARALHDPKSEAEFLLRRAGFEEKLGLAAQAQATRKEAKELEK